MILTEWISIGGFFLVLLTHTIKGFIDKTKLEAKVDTLYVWKDRMESIEYLPIDRCRQERIEFKEEVYKDINRIETRFNDFLKVIESQNTKIAEVRENVIKMLTILETKKEQQK